MRTAASFSCGAILVAFAMPTAWAEPESIEFVAEHLAEIAMDNRYATLPLWGSNRHSDQAWRMTAQLAGSSTSTGTMSVAGPMMSFAIRRPLRGNWSLTGLAFFDDMSLSSGTERRPLEVQFANDVPLSLPAPGEFTGLSGSAQQSGVGMAIGRREDWKFWGGFEWTAGLIWQRLALTNYSFDFRVLAGPDQGATGTLDYSATYSFTTPFIGVAWPREYGDWLLTTHLQVAVPLPRQGVAGRISGPAYALGGDTGATGAGTPFGDPSLTVGLDLAYLPWNLSVDLGSIATQALLEPLIHEGVTGNWLISVSWSF